MGNKRYVFRRPYWSELSEEERKKIIDEFVRMFAPSNKDI